MGQIHFDKESRFKKIVSGKGFYIALAVCLVAVGGVAVATFTNSLPFQREESSSVGDNSTPSTTSTTEKQVDTVITNVPDNRTDPTTTAPTTAPTDPTDKPANTKPELFILPLSNEVLKPFSNGTQVYSQTMNDYRTHNGVDFKGEKGQDVKALADGTIESVTEDALWGTVTVIDHGFGIKSRYCGMGTTAKAGDKVKVGDVIGKLNDIPCELVEAPHLHVEILVNGEYADPVKALGREVKYTEETGEAATGTTA